MSKRDRLTAEHRRLAASRERRADWKGWGPYVADRAWGTVREHYGPGDQPWESFPHAHARFRAYRWNEDGLAGFCNRFQNVCLAPAFWNGADPFLKERLFGVAGPEGNHGEDVKEFYWHVDGLPSHAWMSMRYRYPQAAYPYDELVAESRRRTRDDLEFELVDALRPSLEERRWFDIDVEYAKVDPDDLLCRIVAVNRGPDPAELHVLPHVWFRNTWAWGGRKARPDRRPELRRAGPDGLVLSERHLGERRWWADGGGVEGTLLFTGNDTNRQALWGRANDAAYVKDAFHRRVCEGAEDAVDPAGRGTKACAWFRRVLAPGETWTVRTRFRPEPLDRPFEGADEIFEARRREADDYWDALHPPDADARRRKLQREAWAGLLWSKQFYHYSVELWTDGDEAGDTADPPARERNRQWRHVYNVEVLAMPDTWEYPWYAAWDLAFHTVALAPIDPEWAKRQCVLLLREWYMHPNGQLPAYEWSFGDVNPPVQAWAARRVYALARDATGVADTEFLEKVFHKLLLNFTWWVNRKDRAGNSIFEGGFLGLDNIGVFDRNRELPGGGYLEQSDGTAWMGAYCLNLLAIALELARTRPAYEDVATKFFEHFVGIASALNGPQGLWSERDGFYYDRLHLPSGETRALELRSFVGLIPLFAVETFAPDLIEKLPRFRRRVEWFVRHRPHWMEHVAPVTEPGRDGLHLLSLVPRPRLERLLARMLDEAQFLSPHGLRSLSREHRDRPFALTLDGARHEVRYEPAESSSDLFGGNSNWRGPVWFPLNVLMIEALRKYGRYHGDALRVDVPAGSGRARTLEEAARDVAERLIALFLPRDPADPDSPAPWLGGERLFHGPEWRDRTLFYEYFHGDSGAGIGASHQTGWTALVANLVAWCADE